MSTREIKVYSTSGLSGALTTNVSTLGELRPLLMERDINTSGMKMLIGSTKLELSEDSARLPEGDFKIYLMPQKTKSGNAHRVAELHATIANCYAELANIGSAPVSRPAYAQPVKTYDAEEAQAMAEMRAMQNNNNSWEN